MKTTNIIERMNKEFKRRAKPTEIVAGELSCYNHLTFYQYKNGTALKIKPKRKSA